MQLCEQGERNYLIGAEIDGAARRENILRKFSTYAAFEVLQDEIIHNSQLLPRFQLRLDLHDRRAFLRARRRRVGAVALQLDVHAGLRHLVESRVPARRLRHLIVLEIDERLRSFLRVHPLHIADAANRTTTGSPWGLHRTSLQIVQHRHAPMDHPRRETRS